MAKAKNKRNSGLADRVNNKRKTDINKKKLNPFEVHINREKIKVLGKKSKHDKGLPGVSRAKAIQKRKETLGTEMKLMNKTNTFIDRRIGEKNTQLSAEDRMIARFAAERAKQHTKKNIYNLADDEILTHRGQTLEQIEKFDDPRSDEEDDDAKGFGGLGEDFVSEGHFGGGMLSKTDSKDGAKSHKDLIEQLIAESKKRKAEKQKEKEQTLDLTEKLDSEWKDLQPVVLKKARVEEKESAIEKLLSQAEQKGQDYDKMMRELRFEKRGTPSDGLKSDEKQAREERAQLEQWEKEREQRMLADDEQPAKSKPAAVKHRSAEDLDDNFELDQEHDYMLSYDKDGKPLMPEHVLKDFSVPNANPKFEGGISDSSSDDEEGDEESDDNDDEVEKEQNVDDDAQSGDDDEQSEDDESEENSYESTVEKKTDNAKGSTNNFKNMSVKLKDVEKRKLSNSENEKTIINDDSDSKNIKLKEAKTIESQTNPIKQIKKKQESILFNKTNDDDKTENDSDESENDNDDDQSDKDEKVDDFKDLRESEGESDSDAVEEEDQEKIGSLFDLKTEEGNKLKELLSGKSPSQQSTALGKLIKSYDPSLAENNKELLSRLFAHLLQYVHDTFSNLQQESDVIKAFLIFDKLVPHLYDLAKTNKVSTKKYLAELIKEKHHVFQKRPKRVPDLNTLIFFKLVSLLYPTSDFRHPITTPSLIFMSEILTLSRFNDAYSVSRGLFVTSLIVEYTVLSKRLVPPAINFLRGILFLAANTSILNPIQVVPPFKLHRDAKILNLEHDCSKMSVTLKMAAGDLTLQEVTDDFKIRCLLSCTQMLKEIFDQFHDLEAQEYLFEPHIKLLSRVDLEMYPHKVVNVVSQTLHYIKSNLEVKTFTPLSREKKRPKALRLYEPDVQEVFTGNKSSKLSREKAESARLKGKYKKEMKGALREIRRDRAYIANVKIKQKIHSDNVRKEKVKQIYKDASIQQGELNKLQRGK